MTSTITRAVPSSVGRAVDVDTVATLLATASDGATVGTRGAPYGGDGILVAMPEHGAMVFGTSPDLFGEILRWVERVAPVVTAVGASPARYFGAWRDGGKLYLDVVEAYSSAEEDRAVAAGRARNQIAVWHNGRQCEIPTGGTGELDHAWVTGPATGRTHCQRCGVKVRRPVGDPVLFTTCKV